MDYLLWINWLLASVVHREDHGQPHDSLPAWACVLQNVKNVRSIPSQSIVYFSWIRWDFAHNTWHAVCVTNISLRSQRHFQLSSVSHKNGVDWTDQLTRRVPRCTDFTFFFFSRSRREAKTADSFCKQNSSRRKITDEEWKKNQTNKMGNWSCPIRTKIYSEKKKKILKINSNFSMRFQTCIVQTVE